MKNLSTTELQEVNGGGWIADWIEDVLCEFANSGNHIYFYHPPLG